MFAAERTSIWACTLFQSLSGFLMRCDVRALKAAGSRHLMFQSLSGFLMRCDARGELDEALPGVSIPIGFSDAL